MNYQLIHNNIIEKARNRPIKGYVEKHHIIPKCMGGTNDKNNLVHLTAKEHFIIHKLLVEIYPNESKLHLAVFIFVNGFRSTFNKRDYRIGSREYQRIRMEASNSISEINKKRYEDPNERAKTGVLAKKMWEDPEFRERHSGTMKSLWEDPEFKAKMFEAQKKRYEDPNEIAKSVAGMHKWNKDPINRKIQGDRARAQWKDPEFRSKFKEMTSGKNNVKAMSVKVTLSDGIVNEYDTMNDAKKALGFKSYNPIYKALKNQGLHPKFGWHIQRL